MAKFDSKSFNEKAFGKYMETVPRERLNALIKANIFKKNADIKNSFSSQTGTAYAVIPMYGRISGSADNYDGTTGYSTAGKLNTFERGVVVFGRKRKFAESDFSYDITSGVDFMSQVGKQLGDYWDTENENTLVSILTGIFASTTTGGQEFATAHTYTTASGESFTTTTLNKAIQKASGDRKQGFSLVVMNSAKATELENQKLLTYLVQNDANGLERQLNLAQWNGKLVIVDDSNTYDSDSSKYITYVLGNGAFDREDIGAKHPYEMKRDEENDQDILYTRERICLAPCGFSYLKASQATLSPTDAELANGANWDLASDGNGNYYNHKEIFIAKVVSE